MHVITRTRIYEAQIKHPDCASALNSWYQIITKNTFVNFAQLKNCFNSVDKVGRLTVFNIGGNKLRLVASIHYNRQKIYIRDIFTHKHYDMNSWKERQ